MKVYSIMAFYLSNRVNLFNRLNNRNLTTTPNPNKKNNEDLVSSVLAGILGVTGTAVQIYENNNEQSYISDDKKMMNNFLTFFNSLAITGSVGFMARYLLKK